MLPQVEEQQQDVAAAAAAADKKAGKAKGGGGSGKRFEIKKWNAVAMCVCVCALGSGGSLTGCLHWFYLDAWLDVCCCATMPPPLRRLLLLFAVAVAVVAVPVPQLMPLLAARWRRLLQVVLGHLHRHVRHLPQQPVRAQHRVPGQPHGCEPQSGWEGGGGAEEGGPGGVEGTCCSTAA